MNEVSDKPIYRVLNLVSLLALAYYAATSINYIFESDDHLYRYDSQSNSNGSTAQLQAHHRNKQQSFSMKAEPKVREIANRQ